MTDADKKRVWKDARTAVHAYAREPSQDNAARVEAAWAAVRRIDTMSHWHGWQARILDADRSDPEPDGGDE